MKYPSNEKIFEALKKLESSNQVSITIDRSKASWIELLKFDLCQELICFKREKRLKVKELATLMGIAPSRVSEMLHYRVEKISLDKILESFEKLASYDEALKEDLEKKYFKRAS